MFEGRVENNLDIILAFLYLMPPIYRTCTSSCPPALLESMLDILLCILYTS